MLEPWQEEMIYTARKERWLKSKPVCEICKEHIQGEFLWDIYNHFRCEDCMEEERKELWELDENDNPVTATCSWCGSIIGLYSHRTQYYELDGETICRQCFDVEFKELNY